MNITLHIFIVYILVPQGPSIECLLHCQSLHPSHTHVFPGHNLIQYMEVVGRFASLYQQVLCLPEGIPLIDES